MVPRARIVFASRGSSSSTFWYAILASSRRPWTTYSCPSLRYEGTKSGLMARTRLKRASASRNRFCRVLIAPSRSIAGAFSGSRVIISQSCFSAASTCPWSIKYWIRFMFCELLVAWGAANAVAEDAIAAAIRISPSVIRLEHLVVPVLLGFARFALTDGSRVLLFEFLILPQRCFGLLCAALAPVGKTQLVIGIWLLGIKANGRFQTRDGRRQIAFFQKGLSQPVMSIRIIRFLPDDVGKHINRLRLLLLGRQDMPEAVLG